MNTYSKVEHRVSVLWKYETEPVVWWVTSAQRAQLCTRLYLYVLSKVAMSKHWHMTKNKTNNAQQHRVQPSKHSITTETILNNRPNIWIICDLIHLKCSFIHFCTIITYFLQLDLCSFLCSKFKPPSLLARFSMLIMDVLHQPSSYPKLEILTALPHSTFLGDSMCLLDIPCLW